MDEENIINGGNKYQMIQEKELRKHTFDHKQVKENYYVRI